MREVLRFLEYVISAGRLESCDRLCQTHDQIITRVRNGKEKRELYCNINKLCCTSLTIIYILRGYALQACSAEF